jgi:hypothetical protein
MLWGREMTASVRWDAVVIAISLCGMASADIATPNEPLRGVAPDLGFSVQVPHADWECTSGSNYGFKCQPRHGDPTFATYSVFVSDPVKDLTQDNMKDFIRGSAAGARDRGWIVGDVTVAPSTVPLTGALRFSYTAMPRSEGPACLFVGYIGQDQRRRQTTFMHLARGDAEPPEFESFVRSYRWTGHVPRPLEGVGTVNGIFTMVITIVIGGMGGIINLAMRRVVINQWKIVLALLGVGVIGLSVFWIPRIPDGLSPFEQGETFGDVVMSPLTWPAIFAAWRARALSKKRSRESVAKSGAA